MALSDIFPLILVLLLIPGISFKKGSFREDYLSPESTGMQKGIFALVVMLHHLSQRVSSGSLIFLFGSAGVLAVSVFFFISGYAMTLGYLKSGRKYAKHILLVRLPSLLLPLLITLAMYILYYKTVGLKSWRYVGLHLIYESNTWFLLVMLALYIFYALSVCIAKNNARILLMLMLASSVLIIVFLILVNTKETWWYSSCLSFNLGMFFSMRKEWFETLLQRKWVISIFVTLIGFMSFFEHSTLWPDKPVKSALLSQEYAVLFCLLLVTLLMKFKVGNPILAFLGKISFELYLMHGFIILLLGGYKHRTSDIVFMTLTVCLGIASAFVLHIGVSFIMKKYRKKLNNI